MNSPRLSIIIPFYNVEAYIGQCLDSVYKQDIPEEQYEVICVDDCSPDRSISIVEKFANKHTNLVIVRNQINRKLGGARNAGLEIAQGKYIWFIDSDDYIENNCLASLLSIVEKDNLEVLHFDHWTLKENHLIPYQKPHVNDEIIDGVSFATHCKFEQWHQYLPVAWRALYQRDFLLNNGLYFANDVMFEDTDWSLYLYIKVQRMRHIAYNAYIHRINHSSITQTKPSPDTVIFEILQQIRCLKARNEAPTEEYQRLIDTYLKSQLSIIGMKATGLSNRDKFSYAKKMLMHNISTLWKYTSTRNMIRLKLGVNC